MFFGFFDKIKALLAIYVLVWSIGYNIDEIWNSNVIQDLTSKMLKKLANNQTVMVLAAAVAVAAIYYYSQGFSGSLSGMSGQNEAAKAVDRAPHDSSAGPSDRQIQCAAGGNNFVLQARARGGASVCCARAAHEVLPNYPHVADGSATCIDGANASPGLPEVLP